MFGRPDSRDSMLYLSVCAVVRGCVPGGCKAPKKAVVRTIFVMLGTQIQTVRKLDTDDDFISLNV